MEDNKLRSIYVVVYITIDSLYGDNTLSTFI